MPNFFDTGVTQEYPKDIKHLLGILTRRATEEPPQFPQRQVPDIDPLTQLAQALTQSYMQQAPSDAFSTALGEAKRTATTPVDVANLPEYQAVVGRIANYGRSEANRLQRANVLRGNAGWSSSAGRDVLGRSLTETQERMMAAAVPFLAHARAEKQQAINQLMDLERLGQGTKLSQIDAGSRVGQILRGIEGAKMEAEYQNAMDPLRFRYETQPAMMATAFGAPFSEVAQPSEYERWVLGLGSIAGAIKGAGQGGAQGGVGGAILGGMRGFAQGGENAWSGVQDFAGMFQGGGAGGGGFGGFGG